MYSFFNMKETKVQGDKHSLFPKADMLHINAHADVSKGLEPKQLSAQNPG